MTTPHPRLRIAVGIATKGRPALLHDTLLRLTEQTRPADRVVLCPASAKDLPEHLPLACEVVSAPVGLPAQRNAILDVLGDTDVVVFFDDDFFPGADYLARVEQLFQEHPALAVVRGTLIADGTKSATTFPWVFLFPAGVLVLILVCANLAGDGLRDALDPGSQTLRRGRKKNGKRS